MRYALIVAVLVALAGGSVCADINFGGYARSIGMGGAGLAVVDDPVAAGAINPASYALKSPGFRLMWPSLDLRMEGTSLSNLLDVIGETSDATGENAVEIARLLGKQDTKIEVGLYGGFAAGPVVITADGQANVILHPEDAFRNWATTGEVTDLGRYAGFVTANTAGSGFTVDYQGLNNALASDGYAANLSGMAVYSLPAVGVGFKLPKHPSWHVGVRIKALKSNAVSNRVIPDLQDGDVDLDSSGRITGISLADALTTDDNWTGKRDVEDSGMGADIGVIYQSPNPKMQLTAAMVWTNFVKPSLEAVDLEKMISLGAALRLSNKFLVAADLVNITGSYGQNMRLRMGAEFTPVRWFAIRAGYGGGNPTFGLGIGGFDLAISKDTPALIGRLWKF